MPLHDVQMFCFLVAGVLTWWPLLTPTTRHIRMSSPVQIVYLAAESIPLDLFGAFALFTNAIFYPTYAAAPHFWGLSALMDQEIGGAILAVPGNILDVILMSIVFFGWIAQVERAQRAHERALYDSEDTAADTAEIVAAEQTQIAERTAGA
jgi:cytochrome c oxidase assembly factor CtaG